MKILRFFVFLITLMSISYSVFSGQKKALIIGNSNYNHQLNLANPANDSRDVADTLKSVGFDVTLELNATRKIMENAILDFGSKLGPGDIGLFYFSGHSLSMMGENYLIPIDFKFNNAIGIQYVAVNLENILNRMDIGDSLLNIIIIDASRANPLQGNIRHSSRGLARINASSGTYLAYSSAPGTVTQDGNGRNSVYAEALINAIRKPDITLEEVFKEVRREVFTKTNGQQVPWGTSTLSGDFYFSRSKTINDSSINQPYVVIDVFFGTDRERTQNKKISERYGSAMGHFEYGIAEVNIPKKHKLGELESPKWWKFEFKEDLKEHIVLSSITSINRNSFFEKMKEEMKRMSNDDVFVFVHGFNVTFEDSIRRTAQLAHDLQYPGVPVAYSWPSQGSASPVGYTTDKEYSEWSYPHLKQFLIDIKVRTKANKLHVLAHSMGNRILTNAIKSINIDGFKLNQVVLAAPDINAKIFIDNIAPFLEKKAERYSLYTSSGDKALIMSNRIQKGHRLGQSGDKIVVLRGVDTIDASNIDTSVLGHSYYGDERELLLDLYHLLKNNLSPENRNLEMKNKEGLTYWQLRQ